MKAYVKKEDVLNALLGSRSLDEAYKKISDLPVESAISLSSLEGYIENLRVERDKHEFRSGDWERLDDEADSIEWAVNLMKKET